MKLMLLSSHDINIQVKIVYKDQVTRPGRPGRCPCSLQNPGRFRLMTSKPCVKSPSHRPAAHRLPARKYE